MQNTRPRNSNPQTSDDANSDPERLTKVLYREDRKSEKGRGGTKIIHASSTIHMPACSRAHYLMHEMRQAGATFSEIPFGSMRLVWAYGRAAEKHVRDTLLSDERMRSDAYGLWKCACGKSRYQGRFLPSSDKCTRCGTRSDRYHEALLLDPEYGLSGSPDFIFWDVSAYRVVEIKSIKGRRDEGGTSTAPTFRELDVPQPNHVNQGCHYVKLGQRNGLAVHRRPLVLYVSKGFETRQWYKQFIPGDAAMQRAETSVSEQRSATKGYRGALASGYCPRMCEECVSNPSSRQKSCPAWAECMARSSAP